MRKIEKKNIPMLGVFLALLFLGFIGYMISPDVKFSEDENRYLKEKPEFSAKALFSGDYTNGMNDYATDQFPLRSMAITVKTQMQKLVGVKDSNGVYFGKDGYLMLKKTPSEFKEKKFWNNVKAVETFATRNPDVPVSVLLAPTAAGVYTGRLPDFAVDYHQIDTLNGAKSRLERIENVKFVDSYKVLKAHRKEDLYYRTDHHWTTRGAYCGYQAFCKARDLKPVNYNTKKVSDGFYGTLYSKVLAAGTRGDTVEAPIIKQELTVSHQMGKTVTDSLYDKSKLKVKDKYQYFLGGNDGEVTIKTDADNGKHLLVIKDSYANCFLPFLTRHYESIHVVDLRYFNDNLTMYMKANEITEALVLYNMNNFDEDTSVVKLMMVGSYSPKDLYTIHEAYQYPVKPGSKEWEKLDIDQMLKNCEIDEKTIKAMDTKALAQTVLYYPFFDSSLALYTEPMEDRKNGKNTFRTGIDMMRENWPAIKVFLNREDAKEELEKLKKAASEDELRRIEILISYIEADWGKKTPAPK